MSGCETCDFIGPELPSLVRDARELHREWHGPMSASMNRRIDDWQMRVLDRVMDARAGTASPSIVIERGPRRKWRP